MRKSHLIISFISLFAAHSAFAHHTNSGACEPIAKVCEKAGYARKDNHDMKFWQDCMKPIIYGQSVKGVTIDASVVKTCRTDKISELKKELDELQNVKE